MTHSSWQERMSSWYYKKWPYSQLEQQTFLLLMLCMDYSKLWMSKSYFHRFEFTKLFSFSGFEWIATLCVCSFFFFCEFHDFLICSDAKTHSPLDCGILSSASAAIGGVTLENQSANLQAHFFFQVQTALSLFTINAPHQLPSCYQFWHLTSPNHHAHITILLGQS